MSSPFLSPLRYPGGKRKLTAFVQEIWVQNDLRPCHYVEPYAGGASIALGLLFSGTAEHIYINDIDPSVFAFWHAALYETDALSRLIRDTPVTIAQWQRQKAIQSDESASPLQLAFSTLFLNRTNRSGIIRGGVIGGKKQNGPWHLDARFNKQDLIARVHKIAEHRRRISVFNLDALDFLRSIASTLPQRTLIYLDPPYFVKGTQALYANSYAPRDHAAVAKAMKRLSRRWIVSYDDVPQVRSLYRGFRYLKYSLNYTAQARYRGHEIMFFADRLTLNSACMKRAGHAVLFHSVRPLRAPSPRQP